MPCTSSRKTLSRNTALQTGPERPADSALQGREAVVVPGLWRDSSLLGELFLCLKGGPGSQRTLPLVLKWGKDESLGPCVGSSFLLPGSSSPVPSCPPPSESILWKLQAQEPGSLLFSAAQKINSVSPRAITTSGRGGKRQTEHAHEAALVLHAQGSFPSSDTSWVPPGFNPLVSL